MSAKGLRSHHIEGSRSRWINIFPSGVPELLYVFRQGKTARGIPYLLQKEEKQVDPVSFTKHVCKQPVF